MQESIPIIYHFGCRNFHLTIVKYNALRHIVCNSYLITPDTAQISLSVPSEAGREYNVTSVFNQANIILVF